MWGPREDAATQTGDGAEGSGLPWAICCIANTTSFVPIFLPWVLRWRSEARREVGRIEHYCDTILFLL